MFVGYFYDKHVKVYMQLKFFSRTPSCVMYVCMYVCMKTILAQDLKFLYYARKRPLSIYTVLKLCKLKALQIFLKVCILYILYNS